MKRTGRIVLPAVRPSIGIQRNYQARIDRLIREMQADIRAALLPDYKRGDFAQDDSPVQSLIATLRALGRRWTERFDMLAPELAAHFTQAVVDRSDTQLRNALRRGGISVRFQITPTQANILDATIHENVSLIKSIPAEHLAGVEQLVMRSVTAGRDMATLAKGLQERYGVTRRRAAFIARDQNNKATGALQANRQAELGLRAEWRHSHGGKTPRKSHLANNGNDYDPKVGWYDPEAKAHILPGQLPNCRCVSNSIVFPDRFKAARQT